MVVLGCLSPTPTDTLHYIMATLRMASLPSMRKQHLMAEFAGLKQACPDGVFVSLTPGDPSTWSGVIFVRKGPYASAVLRFQISFPDAFPRVPPQVTFLTDMFHPLITPLSTYSSEGDPISANDRERLPPGGFSLRHGFPGWFARRSARRITGDSHAMVLATPPRNSNAPRIVEVDSDRDVQGKNSRFKIPKRMKGKTIVEEAYVFNEETHLTVLKTSLFFAGDGFTAYDPKGQLVFRVDSYGPDSDKGEVVLMDETGRCLLTVRRKRPSLHNRWEGFLGERSEGQKPIFSVRRSSIIGRCNMAVEMYNKQDEEYNIEGSFAQRSCTISDTSKETMAEIRRKVDASANVVLGKDVFCLNVKAGFDGAFAMGLVLILDQIDGYDYSDDSPFNSSKVDVDPTSTVNDTHSVS